MRTSNNNIENTLLNAFDYELMNILKADLNIHYFNKENKAILFSTRKFDEELAAALNEDLANYKRNNNTNSISMVA